MVVRIYIFLKAYVVTLISLWPLLAWKKRSSFTKLQVKSARMSNNNDLDRRSRATVPWKISSFQANSQQMIFCRFSPSAVPSTYVHMQCTKGSMQHSHCRRSGVSDCVSRELHSLLGVFILLSVSLSIFSEDSHLYSCHHCCRMPKLKAHAHAL